MHLAIFVSQLFCAHARVIGAFFSRLSPSTNNRRLLSISRRQRHLRSLVRAEVEIANQQCVHDRFCPGTQTQVFIKRCTVHIEATFPGHLFLRAPM